MSPHGEMIWLDIWLGFAALKHAHSVLEEFEILIDCCWRRAAVNFGLLYIVKTFESKCLCSTLAYWLNSKIKKDIRCGNYTTERSEDLQNYFKGFLLI